MNSTKEKLFSEFPPVSTELWTEKIVADLKGADFEKKLVWKTNEGFDVRPFYRTENIAGLKTTESLPGAYPYVRGTKKDKNDWFVRQDIEVSDFAEANKKALDILNKGVNSLGFKIPREAVNAENIAILLEGILPEYVELNFLTCNMKSVELIRILTAYFKSKNYDLTKIHGSVNIDFIGKILSKNHVKTEWIQVMADAITAAAELRMFKVIAVNASLFNDAGSYITQELGYALAWGNELLNRLVDAGVDRTLAAKKIKFNFGIGSNYFMEIAKFRAARWLWAEIVKAYNPTCKHDCPNEGPNNECRCAGKMNIFARTSSFNLTVFDAYVNLLRTQTEAMSAGIAGVNSLLVTAFDRPYKTPDDFSERIARNQQLLLKEECHFDKVVDPSGGSYYIETLTDLIAKEAWKLFLETEEKGFYEQVKAGEIQKAINASADKRFKALAQRREILLGTNQYPNFTEKAPNIPLNPLKGTSGQSCSAESESPLQGVGGTLNTKRLGEDFETLRLTTENSGREIKAFMLTIGNLAMRLARSQFSSNFLACAGYKVIDNLGFETVAQGVEAARKAGADIIVLCSSDDEYVTYAPEAHQLIGGKEILIIAGAPACMEELKAQGITNYINVRSNVLETLQELNAKLGIR
ncbi:methylmalonyl-CoA mutase small subunit [Bacteroidia bacterium]|nr:methylmalonyl-CoA mutase small subunit [Bacteroidia bacterium]GHT62133.1 methylmalonyl-CoA mutase small subunit [Bacteroidia bacterium]